MLVLKDILVVELDLTVKVLEQENMEYGMPALEQVMVAMEGQMIREILVALLMEMQPILLI